MRARWRGVFFLSDEKRVPGEFKVDDSDGTSQVTLWDLGDSGDVSHALVPGTLHGFVWQGGATKVVSAFNCQVSGHRSGFQCPMYQINIIFSSAALGIERLDSGEALVAEVKFLFDGFEKSYPWNSGFDAVIQPDADLKAHIERSVSAGHNRQFKLGDNPVIGFYDGISSDLTIGETVLGGIEINARSVTIPSGKPLVKRGPYVSLRFDEPVTLLEAYTRLSTVRYFVGLALGYVPRLTKFSVATLDTNGSQTSFEVFVPNDRLDQGKSRQPSIGMSLLNHVTRKSEFSEVTRNWLDRNRDSKRSDSNLRLLRHFGKNSYDEDRLISSVNMFDLLPPSEKRYSNGKEIKDVASVIKKKAEPILEIIGSGALPKLDHVIECAVDGRNHYTHGTLAKVDFRASDTIKFLTDAMEFVYGVSEMLACGWDFTAWLSEDRGGGHPFGAFLREYRNSLTRLEETPN
ncbi:MAG: hypothetical protein OXC05_07540 [Halieaceae bacterium]|nr:hypothetical protein [Halieaceae bacterium]